MGLFDRLLGKKSTSSPSSSSPAPARPTPVAPPAPPTPDAPPLATAPEPSLTAPPDSPAATPAGSVLPTLLAAREKLELRDLPGALALYEEVLATAGDRPDVLVTISGDLGTTGHIEPIVQLVAPRYDADRHGPATGVNLLQAYLALRNPGAAQHVLDLLFALEKSDLEERLWGFSNAIAEMIEAQRQGRLAPPGTPGEKARHVSLVSISKPIWAYGLETLPGLLPVKPDRLRRVAFAQLATPGPEDLDARAQQPEDALGRFARGFPLWLAETLHWSPAYAAFAAIGATERAHYALFGAEWTTDNLRQLVETAGDKPDYVLTGTLADNQGDTTLSLRLWEVKTFRERKAFETRWTPATADAALTKLHDQLRLFFEWKPAADATSLAYVSPVSPTAWIDLLAASLTHFLADKGVLPREHLAALPLAATIPVNPAAPDAIPQSLARLTLADRATRLNLPPLDLTTLPATPLVTAARTHLNL